MNRFSSLTACIATCTLILLGTAPTTFAEMSKWNLDFDHTTIGFDVKHMVVSKTKGKFLTYSGLVEMDPDAKVFKTIPPVKDVRK